MKQKERKKKKETKEEEKKTHNRNTNKNPTKIFQKNNSVQWIRLSLIYVVDMTGNAFGYLLTGKG